jgi:RNA polymerase-binding transcription factor DksA
VRKSERERFREQLLELGQRLNGDVAGLSQEALQANGGQANGNLSNAPLHLADLGTDTFEQSVTLGLLESKTEMLGEIVDALGRIDNGTYGACERCGRLIARERLRAMPSARHCISCAHQLEQGTAP